MELLKSVSTTLLYYMKAKTGIALVVISTGNSGMNLAYRDLVVLSYTDGTLKTNFIQAQFLGWGNIEHYQVIDIFCAIV